MVKEIKKIAVIGAGPVGLYLAWKLSKRDCKVTVFEKEKEAGHKPCTGLISERIRNFIPLKDSLIENRIDFCFIHFPKKIIKLRLKPSHLLINRNKFDKHLLKFAQESGVEIVFNQEIKEMPCSFDKIIGCDGALSETRDLLGLPKPHFLLGLQLFREGGGNVNEVDVWPLKRGFCWKIRRFSSIEYGALGELNSVKKDFQEFCRKQKIEFLPKELKASLVPQGLILSSSRNIALCGDAAGLTKPWSGGGIIWGLTAADILLKNFPNFKKYNREAKRFFKLKIVKGKAMSALVYFLGTNFPWVLPSKNSRDNDFPFL